MQMDGDLSVEEFEQATSMIMKATKRIAQIQREALTKKYEIQQKEQGE